jgi:hypothetical protein
VNKRLVVFVAGIALLFCEVVSEAEGPEKNPLTPAESPHSHIHKPETTIQVTSQVFGSGPGQQFIAYRLSVAALLKQGPEGERVIQGYEATAIPENGWQRMSARWNTIEELTTAIEQFLPPPQLKTVQRCLSEGGATEIGGHGSGVIRLFQQQSLTEIGLSFQG